MLESVERARQGELFWPRSMVERLEATSPGSGLRWAADRIIRWIEATTPDGCQELAKLADAAKAADPRSLNAVALTDEVRRIWYLWLNDVYPQRSVARLYEALAALAERDRKGYVTSLAMGVFIAASSESFTEDMFHDLQESFSRLVSNPGRMEG